MIKAIIFDFFGVLADRGAASFRKTYLANDPRKNNQAKKLNDELARGKLGYDDFIDELAKLGGVDRATVLKFTEDYQPNQVLLSYLRAELKPKYKLGIISNAGADWVLDILGKPDKALFDCIVLSYEVNLIKPEAEIYEQAAHKLGVEPIECIFIDDISSYCQGAEAIGMNSIWYQSFDQMKTELDKILSASPNN